MITHNKSFFVAGEMIDRRTMQQMGLPIGNAHIPPFKQREMPFAALGAAFAAVGAASGVMATTLAVVNAVAVTAMYAGVAMTVVGMVTGDKELMKIGGIVGLAGGVAGFAAGGIASLAAGSELSFGTAGIESLNAANAAEAAATNTANIAANGIAAGETISSATGQAASNAANLTANMSPVVNSAGTTANQAINGLVGGSQAGGVAAQSALIGNSAAGQGLLSSSQALGLGNAATGATQAAAASSGTFLDKFMASLTPKDYVIGGFSALSGGAQMMQANQTNAERQRQYEYQQGIRNQQIKNLNSVPTLTNKLDANAGLNANTGL